MKNQYEYTINSTEDISRALADAERNGYDLTFYNSAFYLRGTPGLPISVDDSLANLHVVAYGPAPVWVSGGEVTVTAEGSTTIYASEGCFVDAYGSAVVYAYDHSEVDACEDAVVYAASDDATINVFGNAKAYLPAPGAAGARAIVRALNTANLIRAGEPAPKN